MMMLLVREFGTYSYKLHHDSIESSASVASVNHLLTLHWVQVLGYRYVDQTRNIM